jgi:hypothetical protein
LIENRQQVLFKVSQIRKILGFTAGRAAFRHELPGQQVTQLLLEGESLELQARLRGSSDQFSGLQEAFLVSLQVADSSPLKRNCTEEKTDLVPFASILRPSGPFGGR